MKHPFLARQFSHCLACSTLLEFILHTVEVKFLSLRCALRDTESAPSRVGFCSTLLRAQASGGDSAPCMAPQSCSFLCGGARA